MIRSLCAMALCGTAILSCGSTETFALKVPVVAVNLGAVKLATAKCEFVGAFGSGAEFRLVEKSKANVVLLYAAPGLQSMQGGELVVDKDIPLLGTAYWCAPTVVQEIVKTEGKLS